MAVRYARGYAARGGDAVDYTEVDGDHYMLLKRHDEIVKIVGLPDVKERLAALGFEAVANTPDEFAAQIKTELVKWAKVVREANIKAE